MVEDETLEQVADNARLDLSEEESKRFRQDLEDILDAFESLDDIDTDGVEPAFHPIELHDREREDREEDSLDQDEAVQNTENSEQGYFKGPRAT